jgi:cation:H+ antiporter
MPVLLAVTFGVGLLIRDFELSAFDGWLMLVVMVALLYHFVRTETRNPDLQLEAEDELPHLKPIRAWVYFLAGLLLLIVSSRILVAGAVMAAEELGVSELVIGLTIVAIGTSLPELAATIASAARGHTEIALGNIIGSNLFNLLAVMSIPGVIATQQLSPEALSRDYLTMTALTVFLAVAIFVSRKRSKARPGHSYLGRILGTLLVSFYGLYYYVIHVTV